MTAFQLRLAGAGTILLLALAPALLSPFSITLLNYIGIYAMAVLGLVLLAGIGGMLSFGQAAFVGIAAYATAWLTVREGYSPWLGLVLGLALTGLVAAILGAVTLRLGGHFLSLSTIAWGLAIYFLFGNLPTLGQFNGISDIPPISIGGYALASSESIYYLIWSFLIVALLLAANLLDSREGRAIRALRGGRIMAESLGIDPFRIKLATFVIAALLSALSGWLYAHMSRFVSPAPFDVNVGILYLLMAMVGGMAHLSGAVVGAAIVTLLKNSIQDYLPVIAPGASGQLEVVVFSVLFILLLQRARAGLVPFALRYLPRVQPSATAEGACRQRRGRLYAWQAPSAVAVNPNAASRFCPLPAPRAASAGWSPSTTSASSSRPGRSWASSGPTAPARPRCSTSLRVRSRSTRAGSASSAGTSPGARSARSPAPALRAPSSM